MKRVISQAEVNCCPALKQLNKRTWSVLFQFQTFGLLLAFVLPESEWLVNTWLIQWLGPVIPTGATVAVNATRPNVVHAFFVITLTVSFVYGIIFSLKTKPLDAVFFASAALSAPRGWFCLWCKAAGGILGFPFFLYVIYDYFGSPTVTFHGGRGQVITSLSRLGLGVFGGLLCATVVHIYFFSFYAIYSFFKIPCHVFQSKR